MKKLIEKYKKYCADKKALKNAKEEELKRRFSMNEKLSNRLDRATFKIDSIEYSISRKGSLEYIDYIGNYVISGKIRILKELETYKFVSADCGKMVNTALIKNLVFEEDIENEK